MAVKPIIKIPNVTLNTRCVEIEKITPEIKTLIQDLKDTLEAADNPKGAGLAAPQIGVTKRVCVVRRFISDPKDPTIEKIKEYVLVNPVIVSKSKETAVWWEACMSIDDTFGRVERADKIKVEGQDENGEKIKINTSGFFARVIQHEIDHLDGILFTSKVIGETLTEKELDKLVEKHKDE